MSEQEEKKCRSFKVKIDDNKSYGRYTGNSPYQAANKALSEIIRKNKKENKNTTNQINFTLVESTKGSNNKNYDYVGKRVKLETPIVYKTKSGTEITKNYKNELKKIKK